MTILTFTPSSLDEHKDVQQKFDPSKEITGKVDLNVAATLVLVSKMSVKMCAYLCKLADGEI